MKINGKQPGVFEVYVAFPRGNSHIGFILKPPDASKYDEQFPPPNPPVRQMAGTGAITKNFDDVSYKASLQQWAIEKYNWVYVHSMRETPGLEWETVKLDDIKTYYLWEDELRSSGFSAPEVHHLVNKIREVNALDQAKLDEAKNNFLAQMLGEQSAKNSQQDEQNSI